MYIIYKICNTLTLCYSCVYALRRNLAANAKERPCLALLRMYVLGLRKVYVTTRLAGTYIRLGRAGGALVLAVIFLTILINRLCLPI